mmetsp:Transcript_9755/g.24806  ORF Transcript_9755/g.24806 Transcript_9755/m.24806 type:complete len:257 (+) Transcript_9755:1606-2376(+)
MHLVQHHVLQLLVVDGPHEDVRLQRLAGDPAREVVLPAVAEAVVHQRLGDGLRVVRQPRRLAERSAIVEPPAEDARLGAQQLDHLAHRHARGEAVRVHDEVRAHARLAEGQVLLPHDGAHHTLLPVPAAELVAELRAARVADQNLDVELVLVVGGQQHAVNHALLPCRALVRLRCGPVHAVGRVVRVGHRVASVDRRLLVDVDVAGLDDLPHARNAVLVQQLELALRARGRALQHGRHDAVACAVGVLLYLRAVLA